MKQLSKTETIVKIEQEHNRFVQILAALSEIDLITPGVFASPPPGQSCKDILAHLTAWEQRMLDMIRTVLQRDAPPKYLSTPEFNTQVFLANQDRTLKEVRAGFDNSYQEVHSFVLNLTDDELAMDRIGHLINYNTYNHYKWAHTAIRRWHRVQEKIKIEFLKELAWQEVAPINQALEEGRIDEEGWHKAMAAVIKPAYLAADNPYAQAGHGGDAATWEASRGFIADVIHRSGTFLDAGCASGILMESVQRWGAAKNLIIEPYGLDIVPEFVERARNRLPQWADRIFVGNIRYWQPEDDRFDFVLIRPEYAPASRRAEMVRHLLNHVLKPGGRLIVFVGTEETEKRSVEASITISGIPVHGRVEIPHPKDQRVVRRLFWIDRKT